MSEQTDIWEKDLLDRKKDADFLYTYMLGRNEQKLAENKDSFVLNIDAEWGMGKTFFLDLFKKYLKAKNHLVISINAWEDDTSDEPFISVLAAFDKAFQPFIKKGGNFQTKWNSVKKNAGKIAAKVGAGVAKTLIKKYVGDSEELFSELSEPIAVGSDAALEGISLEVEKLIDKQTQNLIDKFNEQKDDEKKFRDNLKTVIRLMSETSDDKQLPIFVLIDELDRCRPSYAIALLERVKHLFNVPNLVFVFATNSNQLQHAVAGAYGANFDGYNYLNRFFDRRYSLTITDRKRFIEAWAAHKQQNIAKFYSPKSHIDELTNIINSFNLDLRDQVKLFDILETIATIVQSEYFIDIFSSTILVIEYLKTGNCGWDSVKKIVPDKLNAKHEIYFPTGNYEKINFKSLINALSNLISTYNENYPIKEARSHAAIDQYIYDLMTISTDSFKPRSDGYFRSTQGETIKLYRNLPDMIKSAGKFVNDQ